MNVIQKSTVLPDGRTLSLETGKLAKQADGTVLLRLGETLMMANVTARKDVVPTLPFLPLTVEYKEQYAANGRIPGGFFKREGRPNEHEILTSRVVDRSIRPLFPDGYNTDLQVFVTLLSHDADNVPDSLACTVASAALNISQIPFNEIVSTVHVGRVDGNIVVEPTFAQMQRSTMDIIIAGTDDSIVMVEGELKEESEDVLLQAFEAAHAVIRQLNGLQRELRDAAGKPKDEYVPKEGRTDIEAWVKAQAEAKLREIVAGSSAKHERSAAFDALKEELVAAYSEAKLAELGDEYKAEEDEKWVKEYYKELMKHLVRERILTEGMRLDGRKTDEVRPIWIETSYLPRAHGSALFTRGETQSLTTVTLGTKLDEQMIDWATHQGTKKFLLQYNFPPYCTGEVKPLRGPSRREVGHGNLAERALRGMIMEDNDYTIRVVSEILESNGSSSMATVCAGSLALLDAGIPIKGQVSGIAMGLIVDGSRFAVLSDILGDEDHLGDMDFKVAGTDKGLTACQMDIKVRGLSMDILRAALEQSKRGRKHILDKMNEALDAPRTELSPYAPRLQKIEIPVDMIGAVIGSGGKVVQELQRTTGTTITIEEANGKGIVIVSSPNLAQLEDAANRIKNIITVPEVGTVFMGKVTDLKDSGAIIEFLAGKDGYLHISEYDYAHVPDIREVLNVGDELEVQLISVDERTGRFRLSRKSLMEKPEGWVERPPRSDRGGDRGGDRRGGGGGRGRDDRRGGGGGGGRGRY